MTVESNSMLQCGTLCLSTRNFSIYQNDALKNVNLGKKQLFGSNFQEVFKMSK